MERRCLRISQLLHPKRAKIDHDACDDHPDSHPDGTAAVENIACRKQHTPLIFLPRPQIIQKHRNRGKYDKCKCNIIHTVMPSRGSLRICFAGVLPALQSFQKFRTFIKICVLLSVPAKFVIAAKKALRIIDGPAPLLLPPR